MVWNSISIYIGVVYMAWPVENFFGWRVVVPGLELSVATRVISIAVPTTSTFFSFIVSSLESCGYLIVRVVIVIIARPAPLAAISMGSIVFGWSCSLVVVCIFSVYKPIGNIHELWYCPWFGPAHYLDEVWAVEPEYKGVDCSLLRDILCWVFYYALALYIRT
jgi:hypothetical protein